MLRRSIHGRMAGVDEAPAFFDPWMDLRSAIVGQAATDYINVMRRLWRKETGVEEKRRLMKVRAELEEFFYSDWYGLLCDVEPEKMIAGCVRKAKEVERKTIEKENEKRIGELLEGT